MPTRTDRNQVFDGDGNLLSEDVVEVDVTEQTNAQALDDRMDQALTGLRSYIDTTSPTAAQTATAVKLLCRVCVALVRRHRGQLEGTD